MTNLADPSFEQFLTTRIAASDAYVSGDLAPLAAISVHDSPASILPPNGLVVNGAAEVDAFNAQGAAMFAPGSTNAFEVLHSGASGDLGYLVAVQRSVVVMASQDEPVPMDLRLTEVFRRESGEWRLMHRHADRMP